MTLTSVIGMCTIIKLLMHVGKKPGCAGLGCCSVITAVVLSVEATGVCS